MTEVVEVLIEAPAVIEVLADAPVELVEVNLGVKGDIGLKGDKGDKGDPGPIADLPDPGDLTLIFENQLI